MKRSAVGSPKLLDLIDGLRRLRVPKAQAVAMGSLEGLWIFAAQHAPRGDVGRWSDEQIARACGWEEQGGDLLALLVETRWLDASPPVTGWTAGSVCNESRSGPMCSTCSPSRWPG